MTRSDSQQTIDSMTRVGFDAVRMYLDAIEAFAGSFNATNPFLSNQQRSCCDIPPACWLPRQFGTFESRACPCGTALLRIQVTNCRPTSSKISIQVSGDSGLDVKLIPESALLGPMERKWFTVAATIAEDACKGQCYEFVVRVLGCNEYYARWTVVVADGACGTCIEAKVEDCPDYVHHWYDHFYCVSPCFARFDDRDGSTLLNTKA
jgi:hypothetical protein